MTTTSRKDCPRCDGTGNGADPAKPCAHCQGRGTVRMTEDEACETAEAPAPCCVVCSAEAHHVATARHASALKHLRAGDALCTADAESLARLADAMDEMVLDREAALAEADVPAFPWELTWTPAKPSRAVRRAA